MAKMEQSFVPMLVRYLWMIPMLFRAAEGAVVHNTTDVTTGGQIRIHYDDNVEVCKEVVFLGVGTSMKVSDYDELASLMVEITSSTTLIVADPDPDWMVKTDPQDYAELANHAISNIEEFVPGCTQQSVSEILVGGHSASGSAAFKAVIDGLLDFDPAGFIGLDPFPIKEDHGGVLPIPSLNWGFTKETCGVRVDQAAKAAFNNSKEVARVLFLAENGEESVGLSHCSFTDHGCMGPICPCHENSNSFRASVAGALAVFQEGLQNGSIRKEEFERIVDETTKFKVRLCVDSDNAPNGCTLLQHATAVID